MGLKLWRRDGTVRWGALSIQAWECNLLYRKHAWPDSLDDGAAPGMEGEEGASGEAAAFAGPGEAILAPG